MTLDTWVAVKAAVARDVRLDADDRLDACLAGRDVEVDGAVERAVVGEGQRRHPELLRSCDEVGDAGQPVEQAVLAVRVEMDELLDGGSLTAPLVEAPRQGQVYPPGIPTGP